MAVRTLLSYRVVFIIKNILLILQGREIILKYQRKGTLLRNWAHVFAVMMRLRQLCCHRELVPLQWKVTLSLYGRVSEYHVWDLTAQTDNS